MSDVPKDAAMRAAQHVVLADEVEDFLAKWRGRWPEWRIAQTFVDPAQRPRAEAWFALLQEFTDAAWSGGDPTPGIAKLGWWQEELRGWAKGARRHPLGLVLHKLPAPWTSLAAGLNTLHSARAHVLGGDETALDSWVDALWPCAEAIEACERVLFDSQAAQADTTGHRTALRAEHGHAQGAGLAENAGGRGLSRHGGVLLALHTLWISVDAPDSVRHRARAESLLAAWPAPAATRPRRVYDALIQLRLQAVARGAALAPLSPWAALWAGWRAARR